MKKHIVFVLTAIGIVAVSCTKEIKFKGDYAKDKLVVNSLLAADSTLIANVSHSVFFMHDYRDKETYVNDAYLEIFVNGNSIGTMTYQSHNASNAIYTLPYRLKHGDKLELKAHHKNYDNVSAITEIPYSSNIISVDTAYTSNKYNRKTLNISIKFQDDPNISNYYEIKANIISWTKSNNKNEISRQVIPLWLYSKDIVFNNNSGTDPIFEIDLESQSLVFEDYIINGKEYTIKVISENAYRYNRNVDGYKDTLDIYLNSVSKDYYLFQKTYMAHTNNIDFIGIFNEPVQIYNNVVGGIGVVAGIAINKKVIPLN